jgi:hypothetical protein
MSNAKWMWKLDGGSLKLKDIVMPGSHDAGVYSAGHVTKRLGIKEAWAVCQSAGFLQQANSGSRFFDCRVFLQKSKWWKDSDADKYNKRLRMGHFANEKKVLGGQGIGGAYGGSLLDAISDAVAFVTVNDSEFLILRFSHTGSPELVNDALKSWTEGNPYWQGKLHCQQGNIAECYVKDLRGKVIMIFDSKDHPIPTDGYKHGFHPMRRVDFAGAPVDIDSGLGICGLYKGSSDMATVIANATKGSTQHATHTKNHLHFVYYQQTMMTGAKDAVMKGGSVKDQTVKSSSGAHASLDGYLAGLGNGPYPNIISHDFVKAETCTKIISLNPAYKL